MNKIDQDLVKLTKLTVKEALIKYQKVEIDLLLSEVLKKTREFLFMNGEQKLTRIQASKLTQMVRRREKGEPIAYILGYKDFYGLRFKVNKNVLVPRPETEEIITRIKNQELRIKGKTINILDIGTGSGCIAIALAKKLQILNFKFQITASDISSKALIVAKQNAKAHHVKINFVRSDLLKNIKNTPDIIIANLPYGWSQWKNNTSAATIGLKFEPKHALFTKDNGLYEIKRLLLQIKQSIKQPRLIYLEFDPRQKVELDKEIKKHLPKANVKFYKDFRSLWRFVEITL
ncbi:MAG: peptide chain release factor N(5)-glutamine methyltransferase [Candidatus Doudnabacteria bacterium]|nr:peptide chain release factor N(5)-glutamine methyltransferase [Candidatus Doudnabacteria bacterium]